MADYLDNSPDTDDTEEAPKPGFKLLDQEGVKSLAAQLKKPESGAYLEQMRQLAESPEYQKTVPPDTTKSLKDSIDRAQQLYDKRSTTNDWLEVAQTLGKAVAQFGAAQSGMKSGRDMSNLNMGPDINYQARNDRAFKEYGQGVKNLQDLDSTQRQNFLDQESAKKGNYGLREDYLKSGLKNAQEVEGDQARFNRQALLDKTRDNRADLRDALQKDRMEFSDISKQELDLKKQLEAARSLANSAIADSDLSKKSRDKVQEKYAAQAGKAGIDPNILADIGEQSKDSGILGTGIFRGEDKAKKAQMINEQVVAPIKNMLDSIQARKKQLLNGQSRASVPQSDSTQSSPAPTSQSDGSGKIRVRKIDGGQTGTIDAADFDPTKYEKI